MEKFTIEHCKPLPKRKYGRYKHDDSKLVEQGVAGIKNGIYKTYGEAALYLRPLKQYENIKEMNPDDAIVNRLRRKIGTACKLLDVKPKRN